MWDRQETSFFSANAFGTVSELAIFDPRTVISGNQDLRLTIRRVLLDIDILFTFSAAVAQPLIVGIGLYARRVTEGAHDPLLTAAEDQRADWMWLTHFNFTIAAGAGSYVTGEFGSQVNGTSLNHPSIRAMRKLDQDELLVLAANTKRADPATFAAPTQTRFGIVADASVLYSRTMRR